MPLVSPKQVWDVHVLQRQKRRLPHGFGREILSVCLHRAELAFDGRELGDQLRVAGWVEHDVANT